MLARSLSGRSTRIVRIERGPERTGELQEANGGPEREVDECNGMEQSLRFTRFVVDRTADAVFWLQSDGRLIYANAATCSMLGYSWEELLGMKVYEIDARTSKDTWRESWGRLRKAASDTMESQFRTKAGTLVPVEVTRDSLEYDGKHYVCAIARDMTERKRAQEALARSEHQLALVFDHVPVMTILVDEERRIRRANRAARAAYGDGDIAGLRTGEAMRCAHAFDDPKGCGFGPACETCGIRNLILDTVRTGSEHRQEEHEFVTDRGGKQEVIYLLVFSVALSAESRRHALLMMEDITQRKKAAEALEAAQVELRQRESELAHLARVASMGEMAAALAHEMNQPLHAIANYANGARRWLQKPGADRAAIAEAVAEIASEARRASQIIDRLRKFLRKREPRMSTLNVNDVVRDVAQLLEFAALDCGVTVRLELATRCPPLRVDAIRVQQVLVNLVRNAFDALTGVEPGRREVTLATRLVDKNHVELSVADTGTGFADDVKEKMFDRFFTTKREGMGIGLAISRTIVEAHGGKIWAEANSPQGAVFRFTLPVPEEEKE